jgi:hypothetical protein
MGAWSRAADPDYSFLKDGDGQIENLRIARNFVHRNEDEGEVMSVTAVPGGANASNSTFSPQVQSPPFVPAPSPYLPGMPFSDEFNRPPAFPPVPPSSSLNAPFSQNFTRASVAASRASPRPSHAPGPAKALTPQQQYYRAALPAFLVRDLLILGDPNRSGPATKDAIKSFRKDVELARKSVSKAGDWAQLSSSLDRIEGFLEEMGAAREMLRIESFASDPSLIPYIDKAVSACTNAVRRNLYQNTDYNRAWIHPNRLRVKAHSARNEAAEKLRAQSVIQDALAQVDAYYKNPSNDDIAGVQPIEPVEAGCLGAGNLSYGNLHSVLRHGLRGKVTAGAGPDTPWLGSASVFQGGNRAPSNTVVAAPWVSSQIDYSLNLANAKSLVRTVTYREDGEAKNVLLAPNHYSIDDGKTWPPNPYFTNPTIEYAKLRYTNSLITKAKNDAGFWGCGAFFRIKAPPSAPPVATEP